MLLITRKVEGLAASFICPAAFTPCIGARDQETAARLTPAFARGDWRKVKCLRLDAHPDDSCWCAGSGWWLSTQPLNA
jgi:protein-L-isoaspartate(D-aspartate) O-methyltransferase